MPSACHNLHIGKYARLRTQRQAGSRRMYCTSSLISSCGMLTWGMGENISSLKNGSPCSPQAFEDSSVRSASPSLLSATVGQRLLSRLDDGSGCTSPEQVMALWSEEGIRNSKEILQTLDFSLDERLSLAELTLALDNELLVSGNGIHQAALVSYKNEIQFLHVHAEQASRERDKAKADLELAERRNLQLVSEVDDRHTTMETLNESKIKALELEYRGRLTALRSESEQDSEVLLQQVARERAQLQEEVEALRAQQASHQEEVRAANHENRRLEEEVSLLKGKLSVSETTISRLQKDLDHILLEKFGSLDPDHTGLLSHEERFSEIIKEYELQCRELRDRNDELSSELEMLKNQAAGTPSRRVRDCTWSSRQALATESDSDDPDTRKPIPNLPRKRLQVSDKNGLGSLDSDPVIVSIETELALEQLKEKHSQEVQDLKIQLETKVNFYERSLELMRHNMEVERKDISQGFKMEISELEEQKAQAEEKAERLRQSVAELRANLQSGAWGPEQERRRQREQAELEQNYAREIANLVQRLTSEKDQLEMELKLKMDQEVQLVRVQLDEVISENTALKDRISMLQTDVQRLEEDVNRKKKRMEELEKDHGENREELERLYKEKAQRREETLGLSARNLQLSEENSDLRAHLQAEQSAGQLLRDRLERLSQELEEQAAEARRLQETSGRQERELAQLQGGWQRERLLLEKELKVAKEKLQRLSEVETELASLILKHQWLEQDKQRLLKEAEEKAQKGEKLLESLSSLSTEMEQLRSQVQAASLDRSLHAQELAANQRMLQDTTAKVREMEASVEKLRWEKEQLSVAQKLREDGETQALRCQNQELLHKVSRLQVQEVEVQRVTQECLILKTKQAHLENELLEAQDQCLKAEAALAQAQARHSRETQKVREEASAGPREQLGQLQARLAEEQRRGKQLEEHLHSQARQASTQMVLQQEHYEKVMRDTEEKMEEVERKLKNLRMLLQEKVNQLKEQLSKNTTVDLLLKDLYVENSQLMKALQVTEQRQKTAEKNNFLLQEKIVALNMLLRKIAPAALST